MPELESPAAAYHHLLMRTSRIGMAALIFLCTVEAVAYSPWLAEKAPFGLDLIDTTTTTLWIVMLAWTCAGAWSVLTVIRGRGAGATAVACLCLGFAVGTWWTWLQSVIDADPSRDYVGATLYTVLAGLLFTGRTLARGLLVLTASLTRGQDS